MTRDVSVAAPHELAQAWQFVWASSPNPQAAAALGSGDQADLLLARDGLDIRGALVVQWLAGRQAALWPPVGDSPAVAEALLAAVRPLAMARGITVVQAVFPPQECDPFMLERHGLKRITQLILLRRYCHPWESAPGSLPGFTPRRVTANDPRLAATIVASYEGSRDVPELNSVRSGADIVAGYAELAGTATPPWWLWELCGEPVGVLLLGPPDSDTTELIYLGVVPSARGRGLARQILQFAIATVGQTAHRLLVLNVDQRNEPARGLYQAAGFREFDRREAFLDLLPDSPEKE